MKPPEGELRSAPYSTRVALAVLSNNLGDPCFNGDEHDRENPAFALL